MPIEICVLPINALGNAICLRGPPTEAIDRGEQRFATSISRRDTSDA
jgi:hypothetical protein